MKTVYKKLAPLAVVAVAIASVATMATASAAPRFGAKQPSQESNQLAIQLGAIQLGYTNNAHWFTNPQLLANALVQGQQALLATKSNNYRLYVGTNAASTNQPVAQSSAFRAELYQAALNALMSPVTQTNSFNGANTIKVSVYNPKTGQVTTKPINSFGFYPAGMTPSKVMNIVSARIPDLAPGLISNAIAASMAFTTNSNGVVFPTWGYQPTQASVRKAATNATYLLSLNTLTAANQVRTASYLASNALASAVKTYSNGTQQWAAFNKATGPTNNSAYLPNFGTRALGPINNAQASNLEGLANVAAAVAASAINGLGAINTNATSSTAGLYGKTASNVATLTKALTQAAMPKQKSSVTGGGYYSGILGGEMFGLISQVAGKNDSQWGLSPTASIMQGVVNGAVAAVGKSSPSIVAIATGLAQGFYATYLSTTTDNPPLTPAQFAQDKNNANYILTALGKAMGGSAVAAKTLVSLGLNIAQIQAYFQGVYTAYQAGLANNGNWPDSIAGAKGVNLGIGTNVTPYLNGSGTPVTDTLGL